MTASRAGSGLLAIAICAQTSAALASRAGIAASAKVKDEAKVHLVHSSGSTLTDEGHATGTFPGKVKLSFVYNGSPNVSASLTIYGRGGTLRVRGRGKLSSPTSPTPSFAGTLTVAGGSGRYARAHGTGKLYGVFYRRTYAMVVQAQGTVFY